jgi:hypothetical protein
VPATEDLPPDMVAGRTADAAAAAAIANDPRWSLLDSAPLSPGSVPPTGRSGGPSVDEAADRHGPGYRPGRRLADLIRLRDRTCRWPGCRMPAARCDIDHTIPHPTGLTTVCNLGCLCRHHHLLKHRAGWKVAQQPGGVFVFTAPSGHTYTTRPEALPGLDAAPPPTWEAVPPPSAGRVPRSAMRRTGAGWGAPQPTRPRPIPFRAPHRSASPTIPRRSSEVPPQPAPASTSTPPSADVTPAICSRVNRSCSS